MDHVELIHFGVAREQRLTVGEFAHDAANRPHVNLGAIVGVAEEQFWRSVPSGRHIVRHLSALESGTLVVLR